MENIINISTLSSNDFFSIHPEDYPRKPKTIGEHIRRRRLDLSLEQKDVAKIIGVTESSIWNWEHGWNPGKRFMKKIVAFLGYSF